MMSWSSLLDRWGLFGLWRERGNNGEAADAAHRPGNNLHKTLMQKWGSWNLPSPRRKHQRLLCYDRHGDMAKSIESTGADHTAHRADRSSLDLEYMIVSCRPFYLPREFTVVVIAAVYIPSDTNANTAMSSTVHPVRTVLEDDNNDTYTSSVLFYLKSCVDSVTTTRQICVSSNNKPWITKDVLVLLKARDAAFHCSDTAQYNAIRSNQKQGIKEAKLPTDKNVKIIS